MHINLTYDIDLTTLHRLLMRWWAVLSELSDVVVSGDGGDLARLVEVSVIVENRRGTSERLLSHCVR